MEKYYVILHKSEIHILSEDEYQANGIPSSAVLISEETNFFEAQAVKNEWTEAHQSASAYKVITPEGKEISVEAYMETDDYNNILQGTIDAFLTNKKQKELIALFKKKP